MPETFLACPSCGCHAKIHEVDCPHCGARIRRRDGSVPRTAAAVLLGLSAMSLPLAMTPACSSDVETDGNSGAQSGTGGNGGHGGSGGHGGMSASSSIAAAYGVGGTIDSASSGAAAYGVPITDADGDGYYDAEFGGDDCNDADATIHPGAPETKGDGIDSNCDGNDDT